MLEPFNYPEIDNLFEQLFNKVFNESGRGAILIVTSHIEDFLTNLIKTVLPKDYSRSQIDRLFKYPGHLSSFSSKIELSYAFKLINSNLYDRLNSLRKIRNDAAHSNTIFDLNELSEKMAEVYKLGPDIPYFIKKISMEMMIKYKFDSVKEIFIKNGIELEKQKEHIQNILLNKELIANLEKQVPHWELINGICFICGYIMYETEKLKLLSNNINQWSDIKIDKIL